MTLEYDTFTYFGIFAGIILVGRQALAAHHLLETALQY